MPLVLAALRLSKLEIAKSGYEDQNRGNVDNPEAEAKVEQRASTYGKGHTIPEMSCVVPSSRTIAPRHEDDEKLKWYESRTMEGGRRPRKKYDRKGRGQIDQ